MQNTWEFWKMVFIWQSSQVKNWCLSFYRPPAIETRYKHKLFIIVIFYSAFLFHLLYTKINFFRNMVEFFKNIQLQKIRL